MIVNFNEFINENGFGLNPFSDSGAQYTEPGLASGYTAATVLYNGKIMGSSSPYDPTLSLGGINKAESDAMGSRMRLAAVMSDIFVKVRGSKKDIIDFKHLKIKKIIQSNSGGVDVYISFIINDEEYWGKISNLGLIGHTKVTTEFDRNLYDKLIQTRFVGQIITKVEELLTPKTGIYKTEKILTGYTEAGAAIDIPAKTKLEVLSIDNSRKIFNVKVSNKILFLSGMSWYYFNYWLTKI